MLRLDATSLRCFLALSSRASAKLNSLAHQAAFEFERFYAALLFSLLSLCSLLDGILPSMAGVTSSSGMSSPIEATGCNQVDAGSRRRNSDRCSDEDTVFLKESASVARGSPHRQSSRARVSPLLVAICRRCTATAFARRFGFGA